MSLLPEVLREIADRLHRDADVVLAVYRSLGYPDATLDSRLTQDQRRDLFRVLLERDMPEEPSPTAGASPAPHVDPRVALSHELKPAPEDTAAPLPALEASSSHAETNDTALEAKMVDPEDAFTLDRHNAQVAPTADPSSESLRFGELLQRVDVLTRERDAARKERDRAEHSYGRRERSQSQVELETTKKELEAATRELRQLRRDGETHQRAMEDFDEKLRDRDSQLADTQAKLKESQQKSRELKRELSNLAAALTALEQRSGLDFLFPSPLAQAWVENRRRPAEMRVRAGVVCLGSGPLNSSQLSSVIERFEGSGATVEPPGDSYADILVIGRDEFFVEDIEAQIRARSGRTLRIYSQEMFLAALLLNDDPFESASNPTKKSFAEGHSGLELLLSYGFQWPIIKADALGAGLFDADMEREESPPHRMGYVVGVTKGLAESERRHILGSAFTGELPSVGTSKYMKAWGTPGSATRLRRMANHLAWLVRRCGKQYSLATARAEWTADLKWLERKLYEPWMRFRWPSTEVD